MKNKKKIDQSTRNAICLSLNLKYQFIFYINKQSVEATILFFILALKIKLLRGFMIAYLHYADNYHSKILAMFFHHNEIIYKHFYSIEWIDSTCASYKQTTADAAIQLLWRRAWKALGKLARYARKMLVNHLVMMEKHSKDFAVIIICIMQVCNHKSTDC